MTQLSRYLFCAALMAMPLSMTAQRIERQLEKVGNLRDKTMPTFRIPITMTANGKA